MKCTSAPFFGSHVGDGLRKVPAVTVKVLRVVLALAIGMVYGFCQYDGSVLSRPFAVTLGIFDSNLNNMRVAGNRTAFGDGEATVSRPHLYAVIGDAEADGEAKRPCEPVGRCAGIGVNEHRNYDTGWHGSVGSHSGTLRFSRPVDKPPFAAIPSSP